LSNAAILTGSEPGATASEEEILAGEIDAAVDLLMRSANAERVRHLLDEQASQELINQRETGRRVPLAEVLVGEVDNRSDDVDESQRERRSVWPEIGPIGHVRARSSHRQITGSSHLRWVGADTPSEAGLLR